VLYEARRQLRRILVTERRQRSPNMEVNGNARGRVYAVARSSPQTERLDQRGARLIEIAAESGADDLPEDRKGLCVAEDVCSHRLCLAVPRVELAESFAKPTVRVGERTPSLDVGGRMKCAPMRRARSE
jgi:hypothetical protein